MLDTYAYPSRILIRRSLRYFVYAFDRVPTLLWTLCETSYLSLSFFFFFFPRLSDEFSFIFIHLDNV
ncbi:unnamed protein product [Penicillium nalgiovense]|uniref:Uncharacterized protein n=1 Tax=Penicillium nalgiovense TaxID=60175 RepID=A0A9W4NB59_PENNA|nr:unnamed protein product [Penicillium nalgiovense]CAG8328532.1 unnamed protein product [Penicillium nalgiovense]